MTQASQFRHPAANLYINLIKKNLTRTAFLDLNRVLSEDDLNSIFETQAIQFFHEKGLQIIEKRPFDAEKRRTGNDWPAEAETMVGSLRLENIEACVKDVIDNNVPGDFMETGVWRGGASILMRAILAACGDRARTVWVADSFQGLPKPDPKTYPHDSPDTDWGKLWQYPELAISLQTVKDNFQRYGLLDDQVRFLPGWFRDTLPTAPVQKLALLRLDGDMYESTIVALDSLYTKISPGGYVIIDDYGAIPICKQAVDDFRAKHSIVEPIHTVDWTGAYWKVERQIASA